MATAIVARAFLGERVRAEWSKRTHRQQLLPLALVHSHFIFAHRCSPPWLQDERFNTLLSRSESDCLSTTTFLRCSCPACPPTRAPTTSRRSNNSTMRRPMHMRTTRVRRGSNSRSDRSTTTRDRTRRMHMHRRARIRTNSRIHTNSRTPRPTSTTRLRVRRHTQARITKSRRIQVHLSVLRHIQLMLAH